MTAPDLQQIARDTLALPNSQAWAAILGALLSAGVSRRHVAAARVECWAERKRLQREAAQP